MPFPKFRPTLRPRLFLASGSTSQDFAKLLERLLSQHVDTEHWADGAFFPGRMTLDVLHSLVRRNEFSACIFAGPEANNHNVLVELGMLLSVNGAGRTFVILWGDNQLAPSDIAGVTYIRIASSISNIHEAAHQALSELENAIGRLWQEGGITARGSGWHDYTCRVMPFPDMRCSLDPYEEHQRVTLDIPEAIVIQSDNFVSFRANFVMHNYLMPVTGQFFGRGSKQGDVAYVHYSGIDPSLPGCEFFGTMVALIPRLAPIHGVFMSREEIVASTGQLVTVGGFHLERDS